ncbi:hypothetical protein [Avibacterium sp. 21-599]|uniref:hypothetical protein n=1 Tax=Avibacterium sp. 21-599 TaxID=2911528 RepID=UPI0022467773|nr:hypothetical protein [Avibacterium sp. 21-599]MCW9718293.1 hypothetical protein [Avibacterium sp. 21-599]
MSFSIEEGSLKFIFQNQVTAVKYDNWIHYRNQFKDRCYKNNKAVDFIACDRDTAWLCEIKDFRIADRNPEKIPLYDEIAIKIRDTLAGLISAKLLANDRKEKEFAKKVLRCRKINIILHIEQPETPYYNLSDLKDKLCQLLKAIDPHVKVMSKKKVYNVPWSVEYTHT